MFSSCTCMSDIGCSFSDLENLQIEDVEREMETEKQIAEVESKDTADQQEEESEDFGMLPDVDGKSIYLKK